MKTGRTTLRRIATLLAAVLVTAGLVGQALLEDPSLLADTWVRTGCVLAGLATFVWLFVSDLRTIRDAKRALGNRTNQTNSK